MTVDIIVGTQRLSFDGDRTVWHWWWSRCFEWAQLVFVAAPKSSSSQSHKESQRENKQDWKETAVTDDRSTIHAPS